MPACHRDGCTNNPTWRVKVGAFDRANDTGHLATFDVTDLLSCDEHADDGRLAVMWAPLRPSPYPVAPT
jgi:hypothetical protein